MTQGFRIAPVRMAQVEPGDHVQTALGVVFRVHGKNMSFGSSKPLSWTLTSEDGVSKIEGDDHTIVNKVVRA